MSYLKRGEALLGEGGHAPVNWAIFNSFAITLAERGGFRTVPNALESLANMLDKVYLFFV
jgi:hypothetical protein